MDKIFTPREVDRLIPQLDSVFHHMEFSQKRARELAQSKVFTQTAETAAQVAESARLEAQIEFLLRDVQEGIAYIARLGGVVKDLGAGLVDFPGQVDGEEVW